MKVPTHPTPSRSPLHASRLKTAWKEDRMLKLDQYAEGILFECDHCQFAGELEVQIIEEDGQYICWNCLSELNHRGKSQKPPVTTR